MAPPLALLLVEREQRTDHDTRPEPDEQAKTKAAALGLRARQRILNRRIPVDDERVAKQRDGDDADDDRQDPQLARHTHVLACFLLLRAEATEVQRLRPDHVARSNTMRLALVLFALSACAPHSSQSG